MAKESASAIERNAPSIQPGADTLVEIRDVHYSVGSRKIFEGLNLSIPRGRITAIMGPSGTGKTTLLRLVTGQLKPDKGQVLFDGVDVAHLKRRDLYALRRRMGMLFQTGGLLTDIDVFENVAFPLREHTQLPEALIRNIVLTKLQAVGLRGAARLHAFRAFGRYGATRRAGARHGDRPRSADLRRAVHGARSHLDGHDRAAGTTDELRAGHHQHRGVARRRGAVDPR